MLQFPDAANKYADLGLSDTENTEEEDSSDDEGIVIGSSGFTF